MCGTAQDGSHSDCSVGQWVNRCDPLITLQYIILASKVTIKANQFHYRYTPKIIGIYSSYKTANY